MNLVAINKAQSLALNQLFEAEAGSLNPPLGCLDSILFHFWGFAPDYFPIRQPCFTLSWTPKCLRHKMDDMYVGANRIWTVQSCEPKSFDGVIIMLLFNWRGMNRT